MQILPGTEMSQIQSTILNTLLLLLHDITFAEPCFKGSSLIPIHLCYIYAISPCLFALQMAFGLIFFPCSINDSRAYSQLMYVCAVHGPLYSYFHRTLSGKNPLVYRKWYMFLPTTTQLNWVVNNSYCDKEKNKKTKTKTQYTVWSPAGSATTNSWNWKCSKTKT